MKILLHDNVLILTGKDRGRTGVITKIKDDRVVVEGINKMVKHVKGKNGQPGERVEFFAPIHISNVSLIDPKSKKATRIGYKFEGNQKMRISKKSGEVIARGTKQEKKVKAAVPAPKAKQKK